MSIADDGAFMSKLSKSLSPTLLGWSESSSFCTWNGVKCHITNRVTPIDLAYKTLDGTLPSNLNSLSKLTSLFLQSNSLSGPLPSLANLTMLQTISLGGNNFSSIPDSCFQGLTSLQKLSMASNINLAPWTFPTELSQSSNLLSLDLNLSYNKLTGDLPKGVSFDLDGTINSFCQNTSGPCDPRVTTLLHVAKDFGYPLQLADSWKGNNPCQDWSFIVCSAGNIITVNLAKQKLEGTISPAFANLTDLRNLYLGDNNLTGSIPQSLTTLLHLQVLDVSNNNLSGEIPQFSSMTIFISTGNVLLQLGSLYKNTTASVPLLKNTTASSPLLAWILGASLFGVGAILFIVIICRVPKRYSYAEVKRFTNSFRDKLGQGGYGVVYKASLPDGRHVAVKVISKCKGNGEEFINEVASLTKTSHVNIVSLLGFCYDKNKRALIYELMSNGSLDKFIYRSGFPNAICDLDWNTLFQIVLGIARGLEYLHQGCISRILHLDIKPQNILLDEDFCPKISDFGLAKICQKKESIVSMLGTRGTIGYIAPEVFSRAFGGVSSKSDVYSYGMLILEMTGGRKNYDTGGSHTTDMYFPDWIYKDLEQGTTHLNRSTISEEENDMVKKITMVSLWCIQTNPSDRPPMSKVIEMLQGPLHSMPYPPKPVLFSPKGPSLQMSDMSS
ncbi:serine/threonine protein kinase, partial [Trifolium pratense]